MESVSMFLWGIVAGMFLCFGVGVTTVYVILRDVERKK